MELKNVVPKRYQNRNATRVLSRAKRAVLRNGNFTTVVYFNGRGVVAGVAKRNAGDDPMDHERGERIATIRAYRQYVENGWQ